MGVDIMPSEKEIYLSNLDTLEMLLDIVTSDDPEKRLRQKIAVYENKVSVFDAGTVTKLKETYGYTESK